MGTETKPIVVVETVDGNIRTQSHGGHVDILEIDWDMFDGAWTESERREYLQYLDREVVPLLGRLSEGHRALILRSIADNRRRLEERPPRIGEKPLVIVQVSGGVLEEAHYGDVDVALIDWDALDTSDMNERVEYLEHIRTEVDPLVAHIPDPIARHAIQEALSEHWAEYNAWTETFEEGGEPSVPNNH